VETCETVHGIECDTADIELPAELIAILDNQKEFVLLGGAFDLGYVPDPEIPDDVPTHQFDQAIVLYGGPGCLAILGNFIVDERGIVNIPPQETD